MTRRATVHPQEMAFYDSAWPTMICGLFLQSAQNKKRVQCHRIYPKVGGIPSPPPKFAVLHSEFANYFAVLSKISALLWSPDAELAAQVHEAHQVEHAVVVAVLARWDRRVPERFSEFFGAGFIGCGQTCDGVGSGEA